MYGTRGCMEEQATRVEDMAFGVLAPRVLKRCRERMELMRDEHVLMRACEIILDGAGLTKRDIVVSRRKGWYSIWRKCMRKKTSVIHDLIALRVVVNDDAQQCYVTMSRVKQTLLRTNAFASVFLHSEKDHIRGDHKFNGYQSLHARFGVVVSPAAEEDRVIVLEVQVRTRAMDRHATLGPSAHWAYKFDQSKKDEADT